MTTDDGRRQAGRDPDPHTIAAVVDLRRHIDDVQPYDVDPDLVLAIDALLLALRLGGVRRLWWACGRVCYRAGVIVGRRSARGRSDALD